MLLGGSLLVVTLFTLGTIHADELPRPRFVVLGQQGVGKSSISNALFGYDNTAKSKQQRKQSPFKIGHGLKSKTQLTTFSTGQWLGDGANITVVDTPGFKDSKDAAFVEELTSVLGDEVPEIDSFLIVYKYKDRFTAPFKRTLNMIAKMFGNIWPNVVLVVNFWDAGESHRLEREALGITKDSYTTELQKIFKKQIGSLNHDVPVVFLDSHYSRDDQAEVDFFQNEATKLYKVVGDMKAFECAKRSDIASKMKMNKGKAARQRRKLKRRQRKLKEKLEHTKFNLKYVTDMADYYKNHCPGVTPGCKWGDWSPWGACIEGKRVRRRPRLVGEGSCDGEEMETEEGCVESESDNWLENPLNVAYTFGGRTAEKEGEPGAQVFSNTIDCAAPAFPAWRERMTAAYSQGQGIMACGGLTNTGDPADECWVFTEENQAWVPAASSGTASSGAVSSWYKGEYWMLGGTAAKLDDKPKVYKQNLVKQAMIYNPSTKAWTVSEDGALKEIVQDACMVNIADDDNAENLVITGGTERKIQFDKKLHGKKTAYVFNDNAKWDPLPNMKVGRASHSCSVATIGGSLGIVVAGGSNDGDSVEFLDWDEKKKWTKLARLSRQRRVGPGMAFIRGKLSLIGGYTWPESVGNVELFDADEEVWTVDGESQGNRFNHVALTVPASLLPQCALIPMISLG